MTRYIRQLVLSFIVGWVALAGVASATTTSPAPSAAMIVEQPFLRESQPRIGGGNLNNYSLFDLISFRLEGSKVTLLGQVWWPALKPSAERIVAKVEGVTSVDNQIEVLPGLLPRR